MLVKAIAIGGEIVKYRDFKSYIQKNYYDDLSRGLQVYVDDFHDGIGFHGINVLSITEQKVDNIEVKSLLCRDEGLGDLIRMEARVSADIIEMSMGTKAVEAARKTRWFIVHMTAELKNGLHDLKVQKVEEYYSAEFDPEGALDAYLIPYIYTKDLENIADEFFDLYCQDAIFNEYQLPYGHVMQQMGLSVVEGSLPDNVFGRIYFKPATIKYWTNANRYIQSSEVEEKIRPGTMVINKRHYFMGEFGSALNTIAHELAHWYLHQKFFEILALLDADMNQLSCEITPQIPDSNMNGVQKAIWWAEWQANNLAPRIAMPREIFFDVLNKCYMENYSTPVFHKGEHLEIALEKTAQLFGVSKFEAKVRAIQLGIMEAEGTYIWGNRRYTPAISFARNALKKNQTFIIDKDNYEDLLVSDEEFAKMIDDQEFVYAECFVVLNDPLYVKWGTDYLYDEKRMVLTDYARDNADECCLRFERYFDTNGNYDFEYYGQCYLSKELTNKILVETKLTDDLDNQNIIDRAKVVSKLKNEGNTLMSILRNLPTSFSGTFDSHMKRVKQENGRKMTNIEMSIRTGLSEDYIAKLRKEELNVQSSTVAALCMGLHLEPCFSKDMLEKARANFPLTEEGYYQKRLLEEFYMEPLTSVDALLREAGLSTWGKE